MWRAFRVFKKGCLIRDLKVKPSVSTSGNEGEEQQGRTLCTTTGQVYEEPFLQSSLRTLVEDLQRLHGGWYWDFGLAHGKQTVTDGQGPATGRQSAGFSSAKNQQKTEGNDENGHTEQETNCKWKNCSGSCQHDSWSSTYPCHVLEAVGWGTAILTGFRISHLLQSSKDRQNDVDHCWLTHLQSLAASFLQFDTGYLFSSSVKSVLPKGVFSSLPLPSSSTSNVQETLPTEFVTSSANFKFGGRKEDRTVPLVKSASTQRYEKVDFVVRETTASTAATDLAESDFARALGNWHDSVKTVAAMMMNAEGVRMARMGNTESAISMWQKAVKEDDSVKAHFNLALAYELGLGVEQNLDKAFEHYLSAAQKDHPASMFNCAMIYLRRSKHKTRGSKDRSAAIKLLEKAAGFGLKEAQRELGILYTEPPNRDMNHAASLFKKAAEQKDVKATYFLGVCYENGWGIEQNEAMAAKLYERAAAGGHAEAQYNLGVFYETGKGGLRLNQKKATEFYKVAAAGGCKKAQQQLKHNKTAMSERDEDDESYHAKGTVMWPPHFSTLISEEYMLNDDSDPESITGSDSASDSSGDSLGSESLSSPKKHAATSAKHQNQISFDMKKAPRSGIFMGFSSDEDLSDSSEVQEYEKHTPGKFARFGHL